MRSQYQPFSNAIHFANFAQTDGHSLPLLQDKNFSDDIERFSIGFIDLSLQLARCEKSLNFDVFSTSGDQDYGDINTLHIIRYLTL